MSTTRSTPRTALRATPRTLLAGALLAVGALAPVATLAPAAQAAPYCGITWGSLPKVTGFDTAQAPMTDVRSGRHTCFDRVVVDISGDAGEYAVRYVSTYRAPGSGQALALRGGAKIEVLVGNPAYDADGDAVYDPANPAELVSTAGYSTLRQVRLGGSFEGQTSIGLGVRARLPMRAFVLDGPGSGQRLVVDVAHRW
ncbi:AMIN-like domain-containing (lipo)protein [Serinicoccus chungangensis]|uniref:AMIN-like domain-containing (lipo)protein n=1 Tax=Serinicoccus chungangensis TaxID=767452 RepID=UPI00111A00E3|nr:hypothetical protein [Serinicoccus chungangensis]